MFVYYLPGFYLVLLVHFFYGSYVLAYSANFLEIDLMIYLLVQFGKVCLISRASYLCNWLLVNLICLFPISSVEYCFKLTVQTLFVCIIFILSCSLPCLGLKEIFISDS